MNKTVPDLCLHYFLGGRDRQLKKDGRYYAVQNKKQKTEKYRKCTAGNGIGSFVTSKLEQILLLRGHVKERLNKM